jgi:WD40 repeat protein
MKLTTRHEWKLPAQCLDLDLTGDGRLFGACYDGSIVQVDTENGKFETLAMLRNIASGVHWCPRTERLIAADYDGALHWIEPGSKTVERSYTAHGFWSWQSAIDPARERIASCTGQYLVGGYDYEPAGEREPSVKVLGTREGETQHEFAHVPPVQSVAFSPDGRHLAAGNLMGEVRIWDLESGDQTAQIETGSFTGWGIIKGHYYTGGAFALHFAPDGGSIYIAGMGSTRDPAAGNGDQLWERWSWRDGKPEKLAAARGDQIGQGLMETLAFSPNGQQLAMAGRLFKGDWNVAIFDSESGERTAHANTKMRTSKALWSPSADALYLAGGGGQGKSVKDFEQAKPWGKLKVLAAED